MVRQAHHERVKPRSPWGFVNFSLLGLSLALEVLDQVRLPGCRPRVGVNSHITLEVPVSNAKASHLDKGGEAFIL